MATVTVSALGGNWSSITTWVGAALPAVGDDIVANATSGPLTVDSNRTCLTINFTGYTNTFTINNGVTLSVTGTAITLGSGMTYNQTTTGIISISGNVATTTITFAGITIPNLTIARPFNSTNVAISGATPTVKNLLISGVGIPNLTGTSLVITTSIIVNQRLDGIVPMTFTGTVTLSGTNTLRTGFTVPTGSTLIIGSNISISGIITFASGSFLTPNLYLVTIELSSTLDSSAVTWYNILISNASSVTVTLISNWNISNNLSYFNGSGSSFITSTTVKTVTVQGSFIATNTVFQSLFLNNIILNLTGQGTFAPRSIRGNAATPCVVNINTSNPTGYVIGSALISGAFHIVLGNSLTFNLVGTSVASAYVGTTLSLSNGPTIDTNRSSIGGSNPQYSAIIITDSATINSETTCLGNLSFAAAFSSLSTVNGSKILFEGNLSTAVGITPTGTSTLEFSGSSAATWGAGAYRNNINVNKSSGAIVTAAAAITYGVANAVLNLNTIVNFSANSNTFTLSGTPLTINNSSVSQFFNMTVSNGVTLNINNNTTPILGTLSLLGNATFAGTHGWTCSTLTCSISNTTITLANSSSGASYRTTSTASLLGTNAQRITMISNNATTQSIWTLDNGAQQSLVYVNGTRIDSSQGATIWSFGGTLTGTTNWGTGSAPATTAYTYVC
jgi:hypothetical protein